MVPGRFPGRNGFCCCSAASDSRPPTRRIVPGVSTASSYLLMNLLARTTARRRKSRRGGRSPDIVARRQFLSDVLRGLASRPKELPCKYFYDAAGSRLFDAICEVDEYYVTRTERAIMEQFAGEMCRRIGPEALLIEFGSGSSLKTRLLLDHLADPVAYVPVDISGDHLRASAARLAAEYPRINVRPVCADFMQEFPLPSCSSPARKRVVYFPGSTIGNFTPPEAQSLLRRIAGLCGSGGGLLIGIDLQKERSILESAYNDSRGVTAAFNLNLLKRINRELDGDFDLDEFEHTAVYNPLAGRIEMYLVSQADQTATVSGRSIPFTRQERIRTELSHKYTIDGFSRLAAGAGFKCDQVWTDEQQYFAVLYCGADDCSFGFPNGEE